MSIENISSFWPEWKVEEQIGEGSFGKVYKAVREGHGMTTYAAIKVISIPQNDAELSSLRSEGLDDTAAGTYFQGVVDDFINEIKLMESMKGTSNIVSVEDFKVVEKEDKVGWFIYIRMELLTPFNDFIIDKNLTETEVIKLGTDVCTALELCARKNVIHRDIKPENIFISSFGDFKVGDFGIARGLEKTGGSLSSKGTTNYMAPEILAGKHYDFTVDIYSLGLVLYRLLNNNRLPFLEPYAPMISFQDRKKANERRMSGEKLPAPVGASPQMVSAILTACAFDPKQRFQSPTAFKNALLAINDTDFIPSPPPPKAELLEQTVAIKEEKNVAPVASFDNAASGENPKKTKKKSKVKITLIAILILALLGGGAYGALTLKQLTDPSTKVIAALAAGDFDGAQNLYDTLEGDRDILIKGLNDRLDTLLADFKSGVLDYSIASMELNTIADMKVSAVSSKLGATWEAVDKINQSRAAFETAQTMAENGDYAGAIGQYKLVVEDDDNYNAAKEGLTAAGTSYRTQVLAEAADYAGQDNYAQAVATLQKALKVLENDANLTKQVNVYNASYVQAVIEAADASIAERNYDQAEKTLTTALALLPGNAEVQSKLDSVASSRPLELRNLVLVDSDNFEQNYRNKDVNFRDSFGNTYEYSYYFDMDWDSKSWAVYNLEQKYRTFRGSVVASTATDSNAVMSLAIYADDELIYTLTGYTRTTGKVDFDVDVSDATKLTIQAFRGSGYDGCLYLVNALVGK